MLYRYPWTRVTIYLYKLNRAYGFLVFIVIQLVQTYSPLGAQETTPGLLSPWPAGSFHVFRPLPLPPSLPLLSISPFPPLFQGY